MLPNPPNAIIPNQNKKGIIVLKAFMEGCGGTIFSPHQRHKAGNRLAIYGVRYEQEKWLKQTDEFWYIDNGYFKRSNPIKSCNGYYRISKDTMYGACISRDWDRFNSLKIKLKDWETNRGANICLVPPSDFMAPVINEQGWLQKTTQKIRQFTDRPIVVSTKKNKINLNNNIWCVVTCISNIQVDALISGIPVITTHFSNIGDLSMIENPPMNRDILAGFAYQQWNIQEMRSGKAWREINAL